MWNDTRTGSAASVTALAATNATQRSKPAIYQAMEQLVEVGVLVPLSTTQRNQSWEAAGLLDLISGLEAGQIPARAAKSR